jgi:putative spermidine/putrescine transport system substrate-binding protein
MTGFSVARRRSLGGISSAAAFGPAARQGRAAMPARPSSPLFLNVIDVAGQLQLTQAAIEAFLKASPKLISKVGFSQAPAPEMPGKITAQQLAAQVDIDLVMTVTDGSSAGIDQHLWIPVVRDDAAALPDLNSIYLPGARKMQKLAEDQAVCLVASPCIIFC